MQPAYVASKQNLDSKRSYDAAVRRLSNASAEPTWAEHPLLASQRPIGNQTSGNQAALQRQPPFPGILAPSGGGLLRDFSRIPIYPPEQRDGSRTSLNGQTPKSYTAEEPEEGPGPVSKGTPTISPAPPASASPATSPSPTCTVATRALVAAPDGSSNTRTDVGVNEQVMMTASSSATWMSTGGMFAPATGTTITWTAPAAATTAVVTATPASGAPCSVSMNVVAPSERALVWKSDRAYTAGLAGSGFVATVTIQPTNVSFSRIQVREESVAAVASGYYDSVLHWNGKMHPVGTWVGLDASNNGLVDTVGTNTPGAPGPFSAGDFLWAIPQSYRIAGSTGAGTPYSTGNHVQIMGGSSGREGTGKEGATRVRAP
jgi:hypothetical protein